MDGISLGSKENLKYIQEIFSETDVAGVSNQQLDGSSEGQEKSLNSKQLRFINNCCSSR
jgi:hypothetical protein